MAMTAIKLEILWKIRVEGFKRRATLLRKLAWPEFSELLGNDDGGWATVGRMLGQCQREIHALEYVSRNSLPFVGMVPRENDRAYGFDTDITLELVWLPKSRCYYYDDDYERQRREPPPP